jgi:3',5'-nucleoside bisphosphate phosphatase
MPADLHVHTTASDSTLTPAEVIGECAANQIDTVAVTDHDSIGAVAEATKIGAEAGVRVVPGVEMTCYAEGCEVHVVGLFIDPVHEAFTALMHRTRNARHERVREMVDLLQKKRVDILVEDVMAVAGGGAPGRPHVAQALVQVGAVYSVADAFRRYIGNDGPAYVPKFELNPVETAKVIREAGGVSIVAHPGGGLSDVLVRQLIGDGIDGIEVFHPIHWPAQIEHYLNMARQLDILVSGGSDSHGGVRESSRIGIIRLENHYVDALEARAAEIRSKLRA